MKGPRGSRLPRQKPGSGKRAHVPVGFITDSESEANGTFNLQRIDKEAHFYQLQDFKKLNDTAKQLGKSLPPEEL